MSQSQIVSADRAQLGANNRPVPRILHGNGTLYVEQRLLTIRFSLAIPFYKPTSGVIVNNNEYYWLSLNLYGIWILEHKDATTLQKLEGGQFRRILNQWRKSPEIWGRSPNRGRSPRKSGGGIKGGSSVSPSLGIFWNFDFQIVTSGVWRKGKSCSKMGVNKNWRFLTPRRSTPHW